MELHGEYTQYTVLIPKPLSSRNSGERGLVVRRGKIPLLLAAFVACTPFPLENIEENPSNRFSLKF